MGWLKRSPLGGCVTYSVYGVGICCLLAGLVHIPMSFQGVSKMNTPFYAFSCEGHIHECLIVHVATSTAKHNRYQCYFQGTCIFLLKHVVWHWKLKCRLSVIVTHVVVHVCYK